MSATRASRLALVFAWAVLVFSAGSTAAQAGEPPSRDEVKELPRREDYRRSNLTFSGAYVTREEWHNNGKIAFRGEYILDCDAQTWKRLCAKSGISPDEVHFECLYPGEETSWYENGQMQSRGSYAKGKKHGEWNFWLPDGVHTSREQWKDGVEDGEWLIGDPASETLRRVVYQHGTIVEPQTEVGVYAGGIGGYVAEQEQAERKRANQQVLTALVGLACVALSLLVFVVLIALIVGNATDSKPYVRPQPQPRRSTTRSESTSRTTAGYSAPGSDYIRRWDPRIDSPSASRIPDAPAYKTPEGEILSTLGSTLGSIVTVKFLALLHPRFQATRPFFDAYFQRAFSV